MKFGAKHFVYFAVVALFVAIIVVGNILLLGVFQETLTTFFHGAGNVVDEAGVEIAQKNGDKLCRNAMGEGIVLYKNDNDALPLKEDERKLNVMGWASTDNNFLLRGVGSGSSTIRAAARKTLLGALKEQGFETYDAITALYTGSRSTSGSASYTLQEPARSVYTDSIMTNAVNFSKVAVVVFSRNAGENLGGELPKSQTKTGAGSDSTRTNLEISTEEDALLDVAAEYFDKVIVIINTSNFMHLGFLEDDRVDAAMFVGLTGQSGAMAIADVLKGDINPSGRVSDIHVYDPRVLNPTWFNDTPNSSHIRYAEDIYYGYKWYETADDEGYFKDVDNKYGKGYDGIVQFPFGFGKSYTAFDWRVIDWKHTGAAANGDITLSSKFEVEVAVTNTGDRAGKEVLQLYYAPPYIDGGIEKASINLAAFAKTAIIEPNQTRNIKLSFSAYDMASYDAYDKNGNGSATYELDKGNYIIKLMNNSHEINACDRASVTYKTDAEIVFDKDPVTGKPVANRFTGAAAYTGVPIDASSLFSAGNEPKYLSRKNHFETGFPSARVANPTGNTGNSYLNNSFDTDQMPTLGSTATNHKIVQKTAYTEDAEGNKTYDLSALADVTYEEFTGTTKLADGVGFYFNDELIKKLIAEYDENTNSQLWEELLSQLTSAEIRDLVEQAGFKNRALASIGKPQGMDFDGPAGFNLNTSSGFRDVDTGKWTAYPSETLIGCSFSPDTAFLLGISMGYEASVTGLNGWYAPGVNLHRSGYTARNFEYYSEDGLLSGKMAAQTIRGAKANGLYCYIKHFVVSEPGPNPQNLNTWLTEQNLRENYLKPFEFAVKEGGGNAVMTAFNRLGGIWCGANYGLCVSVLREEWGFKGAVLTDWTNGGGSGSYGNLAQGIRAGNDTWLSVNTNSNRIQTSSATEMTCARNAAKHITMMYIDTYNFATNIFDWDDELAQFKANLGVQVGDPPFPMWIPLLIGGEVLAALGIAAWGVFGVFNILKGGKGKASAVA